MPGTEDTVRYVGVADWWGRHVWVERDGTRSALPACGEELIAGFAWGTRGIAARELARAILADATGSPAVAERYCRDLTYAVVAGLPRTGFELRRDAVLAWLERVAAPVTVAAACRAGRTTRALDPPTRLPRRPAAARRAAPAPTRPCRRASARGRGARRA